MASPPQAAFGGLGVQGCISSVFNFDGDTNKVNPPTCINTTSGYPLFESDRYGSKDGKWAAFHVINSGGTFELALGIDSHEMWVVSADGEFVYPQKLNVLDRNLGMRYDVIVKLDQSAGDYIMRLALFNNLPQIMSNYCMAFSASVAARAAMARQLRPTTRQLVPRRRIQNVHNSPQSSSVRTRFPQLEHPAIPS